LNTLVIFEKHAVEMTLTVLASFHTFLLYNSIIISNEIFAAIKLLSFSIENMKFCKAFGKNCKKILDLNQKTNLKSRIVWSYSRLTVFSFAFLCFELMFLISEIICVLKNDLKVLSLTRSNSKNNANKSVADKRDLFRNNINARHMV